MQQSYTFQQGATSQSIVVAVRDATTGDGITGLNASTFPDLSYARGARSAPVAFGALSDLAAVGSAFTAKGIKEIGAAAPGLYRVDLPDAILAAGENYALVLIDDDGGLYRQEVVTIALTPYNPFLIDKTGYELSEDAEEAIRDAVFARVFPLLGGGTVTAAQLLTVLAAPFFNKSAGPNRGSAGTVTIRNGADSANLVSQPVNASGYHTSAPTLVLTGA